MKQELLKDVAGIISFTPYFSNQAIVATSATVTIKNPGGSTLVASTAATVNATTGLISYTVSAGNTATLGENYIANWTYVSGGITYYQTTLFDIVRTQLSIPIIDADLIQEQADILLKSENFSGTVDSSGSTSLVDTELKNFADDYWNGGIVEAVLATDLTTKQVRNVTDFSQSSGTLTVGVAWTSNPTSSYKYIVRRGFQKKIERAFELICFELFSRGNRPALILESSELKVPMIKKTLALICQDYMKEPQDKWDILQQRYDVEYKDAIGKVRVQYDKTEDGYISGDEKNRDLGSVRLTR